MQSDTFAFAETFTVLQIYSDMMNVLGGRYVVQKRVETPFHENVLIAGKRGIVQSKIYHVFKGLVESGIFKRWETLQLLGKRLEFIDDHVEPGSAGRRKLLTGSWAVEVDIFNETNAVPFDIVKHIFALFAICCAIGGISFVLEGRDLVRLNIRFIIKLIMELRFLKKHVCTLNVGNSKAPSCHKKVKL